MGLGSNPALRISGFSPGLWIGVITMAMKFSKKGDKGETSLLGGQRIPKSDPRPEAYGTLDEASSALGLARASARRGAFSSFRAIESAARA